MQVSVARPAELGSDQIALWRAMQCKTDALASPFLCPEFAVAVDTVRSDARVAVLSDGPEIVGFFPYQQRRFGIAVPIGTTMNDCQGVVHAPDTEWDVRELLRGCRLTAWQFDCLAEGQRPFEVHAQAFLPSPAIDIVDGYTAYEDALRLKSPQFCKDIARKTRKLEREVGELRLVMDSPDPERLRALIGWKSEQYRRKGWFDFFDRPWLVELVEVLFGTRTDHFGGLLSVLYAGDVPVAAHFGLRSGPVLAHCYPAFDIAFGRCSPGLIQHLHMIRGAADLGVQVIDMGRGPERYKQTLKSHDLRVAEGMATSGPLFGAAHRIRTGVVKEMAPLVRRHPAVFRAVDRVMRHYGRTT